MMKIVADYQKDPFTGRMLYPGEMYEEIEVQPKKTEEPVEPTELTEPPEEIEVQPKKIEEPTEPTEPPEELKENGKPKRVKKAENE